MSWFIKESPLVKKYKKYRQIGKNLNDQAVDAFAGDVFRKATHQLGVRKGKTIVLDDENDLSTIMDFALHDCRHKGRNAYERYQAEIGGQTKIERELLAGMLRSYTSLFRIESIRKADRALVLADLLTKREPVEIIDLGLSKTAVSGLLIFIRLVPLDDFNISAGLGFIFPGDKESYLLRQRKVLMKKVKSEDTAVKRFVAFFKLNQKAGLEMKYN
ncbi:MAG: hypothetical protein GY803_20375 [Chloroflexi bacterium]|nr:hypothetical protein [Chloroflexota bacterium]